MDTIKLSNRKIDSQNERFITNWVEDNFISKEFNSYEMINDRERQLQGIDFIGDDVNYDIKAQSAKKYLNNPTNTFSVEISSLDRNNNEKIGWFINNKLLTDDYLFLWIPNCEFNDDGIITKVNTIEYMIVDKLALQKYIGNIYIKYETEYSSMELARYMRDNRIDKYMVGPLKFRCSMQLQEEPVNIILSKDILSRCSSKKGFIKNYA